MSEQQLSIEQVKEQKRKAWGEAGIKFHSNELALQSEAQALISQLVLPTKIEEVPRAEEKLKEVKRANLALIEKRKKTTNTLDEVISRFMKPEKSVIAEIEKSEAEIIKVKKADEKVKKDNLLKAEERKQVAEKVRVYIANTNAEYLRQQNQLISDSYIVALNGHEKFPGGIKPENIETYLTAVKRRITLENRTMPPPIIKAIVNTQEDIDAEIAKAFTPPSAQEYVNGFISDLALKYEFYELAWNDKEQALALNKQESEENTVAIQKQESTEIAVASFQGMASVTTVRADTDPLKKIYKLDLPETFASAKIIMTAFLANTDKCEPKVRSTKWLSGFGVAQMILALEKVKSDDDNFNFTGLVWKQDDKL